jgi:hypothetical protein
MHLTKEDIHTANKYMKRLPHHIPSGKCKLKQWPTTTHSLGWPKCRALTTPNAGEDVKQQKFSLISGRKGTTTLEDSLEVSYKNRQSYIQSGNVPPSYLPKEVEKLCPHKHLHTDICSSLFIILQTWKQPRWPSVGKWINYGTSTQRNIIQC